MNTSWTRSLLLVGLLQALVTGCTSSSEPPGVFGEIGVTAELEQRLSRGERFNLESSSVIVGTFAGRWVGVEPVVRALPLQDGLAELAVDQNGQLRIDQLELALDDIVAGEGDIPPDGVHLTAVRLSLVEAVAADASWSEISAKAVGELDLTLGWALSVGDHVMPLADQRIRDLAFEVEVGHGPGGALDLEISIERPGSAWTLADQLELSDLRMVLEGGSAE